MPTRRYNRQAGLGAKALKLFKNRRFIRWLLTAAGVAFLFSGATVLWWSRDLPDPQDIDERRVSESTKIFDSSGSHLLYELGEIHRTRIGIDQISPHIVNATLAAEDDQFYEHHGLDFRGILRGVILKPLSGQRAQGGSTITQQLIKNSILTPERTVQRKVKEAVLALELEQRFSKDEILAMYLNDIPYGSLAYGVEAASQNFFGISAKDVTLSQAAILASLPNAPSYYSPYGSHIEDLEARQELILDRMARLNMASQEEVDRAKEQPLDFQPPRESIQAPHFVFYVKQLLEEEYGGRVVEQGGLNITTTIDARLQAIAEEVLQENQERLQALGASNAALVAVDPKNGDILAMAGSIDYFNEEIDGNVNVAIRHRSPGSSIKPFIYTAAFQKGFTPDTILVDALTDFGKEYEPKNYDLTERGPVTIRSALANSMNIPAVKALYLVGVDRAAELARNMGMESLDDPDRYGLSLVLGGGEVRLLDEVSAYGVFANEGLKHPHRAILKVEGPEEVVFDASEEDLIGEEVLEPQIARMTNDVLSDNIARAATFGTGSYLQLGSRPVAAKTGTTQEYRDGWTMGFTPSLATGVWVGNNDNTPMKGGASGSQTAAPIWNQFMRRALEGTPIEQFTKPEPLTDIPHAALRGELPEVKAKWVPETSTAYSIECPVAVGQDRTFKELHSILYYVSKSNPLGSPPATPESDPQFANWEAGIEAWRNKHNEENKTNQEEPLYVANLPEPLCDAQDREDLPQVRISEPDTTILKNSPTLVKAEVESEHPIREVRFILDGEEVARKNPNEAFEIALTFPGDYSGRQALVVMAITENNLIGRAHRTFIINPDDSKPSVTLHTPTDGTNLKPESFPVTVKVTATDPSGIQLVDILYRKEGQPGTQRIGKTENQHPGIPNRYEVTWGDSPGPGQYEVFAIGYDETGNFTETAPNSISIE